MRREEQKDKASILEGAGFVNAISAGCTDFHPGLYFTISFFLPEFHISFPNSLTNTLFGLFPSIHSIAVAAG